MSLEDSVVAVISYLSLLAQEGDVGEPPSLFVQILNNPLSLMMGLFLLFYFIVLLPERRRKADEARMMSTLKKNDKIITIGGIHGTVVAVPEKSKVVTIKIDDNTRMKINRTAIATIVADKESQEGKNKENVSDTKDN